MPKRDLQLAAMHRIMKKAGAERVSEEAAVELRKVLEDVGLKISKEALDFTKHAHRKTIKDVDIRIAAQKVIK